MTIGGRGNQMTVDDEQTRALPGDTATARLDEARPWGFGPGDDLDDRYVLKRRLGHGGMSVVWLAEDRKLDRPVAIKILADTLASDSEYVRRFDREARVAARLVHSNLVSIFDFDAGERPYLVMQYVEGGDLAERISAGTTPDLARLASDLLSALDHIHGHGVIHRDVKPKNVLIGADGHALLTDFGIARPSDATQLTRTGLVMGTSSFIAPEVQAGGESTERSDLYSLGVTLAEASEGSSASGELEALIERMQAEDPVDRPASAISALRGLESAATNGAPTVPTASPLRRSRTNRRSASIALIPILVAAIAAALIINAVAGDDSPPDAGNVERPAAGGGGGDGDNGDGAAAAPEPVPATGAELNDQGYALIQQGSYDEAIPLLEQAVSELEGTGDLTYAFALFNLGHALRLAGRPADAIPVLEQRLEIPNQTDVVEAELDQAYADAGIQSDAGVESEVPPGQAKKVKAPKEPKDD